MLALALLLVPEAALASPRLDGLAGTWKDDFSDYSGVSLHQQAAISGFGGITVDSSLQSWSQPQSSTLFSEAFTSSRSSYSGGIDFTNKGTSVETMTLWRKRYNPGQDLQVGATCDYTGVKTDVCTIYTMYATNGTIQNDVITGVPTDDGGSGWLAGWGGSLSSSPLPVHFACYTTPKTQYLQSIQDAGIPLLAGTRENGLKAGVEYDVTLLAAINNPLEAPASYDDYLKVSISNADTSAVVKAAVFGEGQFLANMFAGTAYPTLTPLTFHWDTVPPASLVFSVLPAIPPATFHQHCTVLGPMYITATTGNYKSPVLDTLSNRTKWVSISWTFDQNTTYHDSGMDLQCTSPGPCPAGNCICADDAVALTPVALDYSVDNAAPYSGGSVQWEVEHYDWQPPAAQTPPTQDYTIMNSTRAMVDGTGLGDLYGRYFQYRMDLFGRGNAGDFEPSLAPAAMHPAYPNSYFGGFRPRVSRISVNYYACAAMVVSKTIVPTSIKSWGKISYRVFLPTPGSSVKVDVLSEGGKVLKSGIASGASIADLDPFACQRLKLRATLSSDPADCGQRPILEAWQVDWVPNPELLTLDRNGFRPDRGETVNAQVRVDQPGRVIVRVHDAAGQSIKLLLDGDQPAQATLVVWDGRNERGEKVAPGVYFMSAGVPGAGKVKRVAVLR
jgi:hypothetical protein